MVQPKLYCYVEKCDSADQIKLYYESEKQCTTNFYCFTSLITSQTYQDERQRPVDFSRPA